MTSHPAHQIQMETDKVSSASLVRRLGPVARILVFGLRIYQTYISPLFGPRCKYYPSCSKYAVTAIDQHGAVRGTRLAVWRLLRCNPWSDGGVDDVPEPRFH